MRIFLYFSILVIAIFSLASCDVNEQQVVEITSETSVIHESGTRFIQVGRGRNGFGQISESSKKYFKRVNETVEKLEVNYSIVASKFIYWEGYPVNFIVTYKVK